VEGKEDMLDAYREMNKIAANKTDAIYIDLRKAFLERTNEATHYKGIAASYI